MAEDTIDAGNPSISFLVRYSLQSIVIMVALGEGGWEGGRKGGRKGEREGGRDKSNELAAP